MIRRLFWLLAGAVLGVTGYRRAGRFARSLRPTSAVRPAGRVLRAVAWPGRSAGPPGRPARSHAAPFLADVRDGMEIYLDRHAAAPDGTGGRFPFDNAKDGR